MVLTFLIKMNIIKLAKNVNVIVYGYRKICEINDFTASKVEVLVNRLLCALLNH